MGRFAIRLVVRGWEVNEVGYANEGMVKRLEVELKRWQGVLE